MPTLEERATDLAHRKFYQIDVCDNVPDAVSVFAKWLAAFARIYAAEKVREAAHIAGNACLLPPDGGSPHPEASDVCKSAFDNILDLADRIEKGEE